MIILRLPTQSRGTGRGRHAIRRAGPTEEASRLRHAQQILPLGLHRTRMSEVRGSRVLAGVPLPRRHPIQSPERILAARLPVPPG